MEKMLITGATGFVGKNFLECVNREKYEICTVQRGQSCGEIESCRADLFNLDYVKYVIERVHADILVLFAWNVKSQTYWYSMENHKWVDATIYMAEQFLNQGGKYIVFAGTSASYDYSYGILTEDSKMEHPDSVYGISKLYASHMLRTLAESNGAKYMEARLFSVFGPYERTGRLITNTIGSLMNDQHVINYKWKLERDYIYIKDAVRAIGHLVDLRAEGVYNISSGRAISIEAIIETIAYCMGKKDLIILSEFDGTGEYMMIQGNNKKLLETGFEFQYSFEEAIKEEIEWFTMEMKKNTL